LESDRLGGQKRDQPLEVEKLTIDDLEAAIMDVRSNADRIYKEIYEEFSYAADIRRQIQPDWVADAREAIRTQQEMVVEYLEEKVDKAPDTASDEFMYQDKEEAERELKVARRMLEDIPAPLRSEALKYRTWNSMPYDRYR